MKEENEESKTASNGVDKNKNEDFHALIISFAIFAAFILAFFYKIDASEGITRGIPKRLSKSTNTNNKQLIENVVENVIKEKPSIFHQYLYPLRINVNFVVDSDLIRSVKNFIFRNSKKELPELPKMIISNQENIVTHFWEKLIVVSSFAQFIPSFFIMSSLFQDKFNNINKTKLKEIEGENKRVSCKTQIINLRDRYDLKFIENFFTYDYYFQRTLQSEIKHLYSILVAIENHGVKDENHGVKELLVDYIFKDVYYTQTNELLSGAGEKNNMTFLLNVKHSINSNPKGKKFIVRDLKKLISISGGKSDLSEILSQLSTNISTNKEQDKNIKSNGSKLNIKFYVDKVRSYALIRRIKYFFQPDTEENQHEPKTTSILDSSQAKLFLRFIGLITILFLCRLVINRILLSNNLETIETYVIKVFASFKNIFFVNSGTTNEFDVDKFIQTDPYFQNLIDECSKTKFELDKTKFELNQTKLELERSLTNLEVEKLEVELKKIEIDQYKTERSDYIDDITNRYNKIVSNLIDEMNAKFIFQNVALEEKLEKQCLLRIEDTIKQIKGETEYSYDEY